MDQNRLNVTLGSEIAQSLQPWPQKTGAAKAFVLDHPVIGYAVALLACEVDQRRRLTGDRVLLLLLLGRYSGVDRGSLHRASPSRSDRRQGTNPLWNQAPVDLLQLEVRRRSNACSNWTLRSGPRRSGIAADFAEK